MVSGQLPFKGDYEQAVLYAILHEDYDPLEAVRPGLPEELERIIDKCLQKETSERYRNATELLADLKTLTGFETLSEFKRPTAQTFAEVRKLLKVMLPAIMALALVVVAGYFYFQQEAPEPHILRTLPLTSAPGLEENPTWSPDGTRIAYTSDQSDNLDIWVRQISAGQSANLTGDNQGYDSDPAWSPDGRRLVFSSNRTGQEELFLVPAEGGGPVQLTHGAFINIVPCFWAADGSVIYAWARSGSGGGVGNNIWAVSVADGSARQLTDFMGSSNGPLHPAFRPSARLKLILLANSKKFSYHTCKVNFKYGGQI